MTFRTYWNVLWHHVKCSRVSFWHDWEGWLKCTPEYRGSYWETAATSNQYISNHKMIERITIWCIGKTAMVREKTAAKVGNERKYSKDVFTEKENVVWITLQDTHKLSCNILVEFLRRMQNEVASSHVPSYWKYTLRSIVMENLNSGFKSCSWISFSKTPFSFIICPRIGTSETITITAGPWCDKHQIARVIEFAFGSGYQVRKLIFYSS